MLILAPRYVTRHNGIATARGDSGVQKSCALGAARAQGGRSAAGPQSCAMAWESGTLPGWGGNGAPGASQGTQDLHTAESWVCRKMDYFLPLNSLLQCSEPEPVQST